MSFTNDTISAFGPEEVEHLRTAFERPWQTLSFVFADRNSQEAREVREALARCIVEIAQSGEKDPRALSNRALSELRPYASQWLRASA